MCAGKIDQLIEKITDICDVYENSSDDDQEFVQNLALFLTSFLNAHLKVKLPQSKRYTGKAY